MSADIYIISGFLGAGKTTLIQKMLLEVFQNKKVVLIENDFGEVSVDAALLKSGGVTVREINSGCICCSLAGNFLQALEEVVDAYQPEILLIEPSGVGKLSDVLTACTHETLRLLTAVRLKITVVDVKRCRIYAENFGEFFEDQIRMADMIFLSRCELFAERVAEAQQIIQALNPNAALFSAPWDQISLKEILANDAAANVPISKKPRFSVVFGRSPLEKDEVSAFGKTHKHSAEEVFDAITIETDKVFDKEKLCTQLDALVSGAYGVVLRAKGLLSVRNGFVNVQYLPGDLSVTDCEIEGGMLNIIGQNLRREAIMELFQEE